jgi:hypothetical protein
VNEGRSLRNLLVGAAVAALAFYVAGFGINEHLRWRRGPWEVRFEPGAEPRLVINQPRLGIAGVTLSFPGETAEGPPMTIRFETPRQAIPFGSVKYDDLTYLPGVVTLDLFGHEIELLPRTLYVNRKAIPWTEATRVEVTRPEASKETARSAAAAAPDK